MLDKQVELRSKITANSSSIKYGIDVLGAKVADISRLNIYEPLAVKEQVINAATEAACMMLRIDEVIAASKPKESSSDRKSSPQYAGALMSNNNQYGYIILQWMTSKLREGTSSWR